MRQVEAQAWEAKGIYFKAMRTQKKKHWEEFLEDSDNIWQAAKYLAPSSTAKPSFSPIACLKDRDGNFVCHTTDISTTLLQKIFPPLPAYTAPTQTLLPKSLPMMAVTEKEVQAAIFSASPFKGPGYDGLSAVAWQKTWPVFRSHLVYLFEESLLQGRLPNTWKIAKIIPLRKPNKSDYTSPSAYHPISLLPTLSKAIESLVAERIAHLSDEYGLLPGNHFGGLKCKNTVDALVVLQEKIYQAWRDKKVLSLVTFDIQGAFNGVAKDVLRSRLRERHIPELLVNWISNFCSERKATIIVNGESSDQIALQDAGLPQGSPLSPIFFLFFNANLVKSVISKNKVAIAFIDE